MTDCRRFRFQVSDRSLRDSSGVNAWAIPPPQKKVEIFKKNSFPKGYPKRFTKCLEVHKQLPRIVTKHENKNGNTSLTLYIQVKRKNEKRLVSRPRVSRLF